MSEEVTIKQTVDISGEAEISVTIDDVECNCGTNLTFSATVYRNGNIGIQVEKHECIQASDG